VVVLDRGVQDGPEQPVALGCGRLTGTVDQQLGMPAAHRRGAEPAEGDPTEGRQDVEPEQTFVEVVDPGS
jgi:hypothetical protein